MWDALGVLALKACSRFLQARGNLVQVVRSGPVPHPAGYAVGSAFVPVDGIGFPLPRIRLGRFVARIGLLLERGPARRARARLVREELERAEHEQRQLLRVAVNERRRPLPGSLLRLGVTLAIGSVAVSAVVVLFGTIAARALDALLG